LFNGFAVTILQPLP